MRRLPDFVIVGAQKAASTLLLHSLRRHPEAWLPAAEQPFFRDPVYTPGGFDAFARPYATRSERRLGLKCPDYLARPEVPPRLAADLHDPDLIVCLRDPVARAVSAYFWKMRWGVIPVLPVEEGLRRILNGGLRDHDPTVGEVLHWGNYGSHLSRYLEHFDREKILVLFDDELKRSPAETVNRLTGFLGISDLDPSKPGRRARNEGVYSLPRLRFLQRRSSVILRWNADRTYYSIPKPRRVDRRLFSLGIAGIDHVVLSRIHGNRRPRLSAELDRSLRDYYRDDMRLLATLVGRDPGWIEQVPGV
jgi:hypothetical protein